jgi:hypothetical protein
LPKAAQKPMLILDVCRIEEDNPAEKEVTMPEVSGSFSGRARLQCIVSPADVAGHELHLAEINGVQRSSDEKWNNARLTYHGFADLVSGSGTQRGYFVNEHPDGDRHWGTFEGNVATAGSEVRLEGKWTISDGTGQFAGISGGGTYQGRMTSPSDVEMTWGGRYESAAAKAA